MANSCFRWLIAVDAFSNMIFFWRMKLDFFCCEVPIVLATGRPLLSLQDGKLIWRGKFQAAGLIVQLFLLREGGWIANFFWENPFLETNFTSWEVSDVQMSKGISLLSFVQPCQPYVAQLNLQRPVPTVCFNGACASWCRPVCSGEKSRYWQQHRRKLWSL